MNFSHITWLDDKGYVKPPWLLYIILAYLARGWCVLLASLTQSADRAALVALIYPQKSDFLIALITGLGALIAYALIVAERKRAPLWVQSLFPSLKWLILLLLLINTSLLIRSALYLNFDYHWNLGVDALVLFWSILYFFSSKHLSYYLKEWR